MMDWTFDLFMEDANRYNATPIKGVHCSKNASWRENFMTWFKNCARDFKDEWKNSGKNMYDRYEGYVGDAFIRQLSDMCFSDFYKDTYNQRPHLPAWYYVQALGLPTREDVSRTFCTNPVKDAIENAKRTREYFMQN